MPSVWRDCLDIRSASSTLGFPNGQNYDLPVAEDRPGIDVNAASTIIKRTPLHWVAYHNKSDVVSHLIEAGADVNALDALGMTPAILAASRGHLAMTNLLLRCPGVNDSIQDNDGLTVQDYMVKAAQASMYGGPSGTSEDATELA